MRASRAYIASLGTTGVLIGFALLLLVVVSAIFGFRGWPAGEPAGEAEGVRIDGRSSLTRLEPVRFGADSESAATPASSASAARARRRGAGARDAGAVGGVRESGVEGQAQAGAAPESAPAPGAPGSAPSAGAPAPDIGATADGVTGTLNDAVQDVGGAVGGIDPGVGEGVSETGQAVSDIVETNAGTGQDRLPLP